MEETRGNENVKATVPSTDYDRSKTTAGCGIFQLLGSMITNGKIKST